VLGAAEPYPFPHRLADLNPMKHLPILTVLCAAALFAPVARAADPIKHDFVAIDEGLNTLLRVNENNPSGDWTIKIGRAHPRDMQLVGGGRILISHDVGYTEYDLATGKTLEEVTSMKNVSSARRLANGNTLVAYAVEKQAMGVFVVELDPSHAVVHQTVYPGDYVRLMRETTKGTFLYGMDNCIKESDGQGKFIWQAAIPGFSHAWKALRLPNGNTLASSGYGSLNHKDSGPNANAFMVEIAPDGSIARKYGAQADVPAAIHPFFYADFQLLANGDVVVANWQGHGPKHGTSGVQVLEYNPAGAIVWQWSDQPRISSIQGVLVLDGLDPAVLHDERNAVMEPLK
jgi:hypothetical protein